MKYKDAGVDIDASAAVLKRLKGRIRATFGENVMLDVGLFGGVYAIPGDGERVLIASADGLGTKVLLRAELGRHDGAGEDLVAHCVNDIAVLGAKPLFFLDYIAGGTLPPEILEPLLGGFADACTRHGIALLGGETAEMPGLYAEGHYDVAGFIVGMARRDGLIDGSAIRPGDAILGFPSSGLHTNGYSMARKVLLEVGGFSLDDRPPRFESTLADTLLRPHLSYLSPIEKLADGGLASGFAHITGGGLVDNIPRILPAGCDALIRRTSWSVPPIFELIRSTGSVETDEMYRVFNMGIGLVAVVPEQKLETALQMLKEETGPPARIGTIIEGDGSVRFE